MGLNSEELYQNIEEGYQWIFVAVFAVGLDFDHS